LNTIAPDRIEDGLFLGPQPLSPEDFDALRALAVTDVVTLMPEREALSFGIHPAVAFRVAMAAGIAVHRCAIEDFSHKALVTGLPAALDVLKRLRARGRSVYVHCQAGRNRSPTLVAAYVAASRQVTAEAAAAEVCVLHPPSCPDVDAVRAVVRSAT